MTQSFSVVSDFKATGDQPEAIEQLSKGVGQGLKHQTLLGVTGSGKTFTIANMVAKVQRPTLVIAHNKTLAAQLATEFKGFFPNNSVEYFVSYYDYYQPEAYIARTNTYIEKDAAVNEQLDKLRHSATRALLTRKDVLIVASVSCIFGLGSPEEYESFVAYVRKGDNTPRRKLIRKLIDMQYERNDFDLSRGRFRVRGDTLELMPAYEEALGVRIEFWGDQVDRIVSLQPLTGEILSELDDIEIYPAKHFVTSEMKLQNGINGIQEELNIVLRKLRDDGKLIEAQRLESRTLYDLEMLRETGYCAGVENYARHLSGRAPGSVPYTLIDYFPDDSIIVIDESHMTLPQIRAMYGGDQSRKKALVEHGFRLPSALDNRPLNFEEFEEHVNQIVYVSATPGPYEMEHSENIVQQVIRPTGLVDPVIEVKPSAHQIDDLLEKIRARVSKDQRSLITTLTKRMAEELSDYLREVGIKTHHMHSEIDTLERSEILRDLRLGVYDVVVGINLLREGIDLPEVSLVAILDSDKEGYLRSQTALIQTIGRASRHVDGYVVMYADKITKSMQKAIDETNRRRVIQEAYNKEHGITPQGIRKTIHDITERVKETVQKERFINSGGDLPKEELVKLISDLQLQMKKAAKALEFEKAALLRDQILDLRKVLAD